jgi:DNA invertase Pin-like site-specific DNA recombinase
VVCKRLERIPTPPLLNDLLILLAILIILIEIYRKLRQTWLRHQLSGKKKAKRPRKPAVLRPKSESDCRFCQEDKQKRKTAEREKPVAWALRKGKGGPKKKIATDGYFCPNQACGY